MDGWEGPFGSRPLRHPATWLGDDARKCDSRVCRGGSQPGSTAAPGTKSRGMCLFRFPCAQSGLGENTVAHAPGQPRMPFARIVGSTKPCRCCLGEAARQASDARHAHPPLAMVQPSDRTITLSKRARVCAAPLRTLCDEATMALPCRACVRRGTASGPRQRGSGTSGRHRWPARNRSRSRFVLVPGSLH